MSNVIKTKNRIIDNIMRVVLYLRLSKEDLDKLTPEERSESIKNQELMLREYAREQNWQIVGIYDDEDYSGSDRDRPNFNKMIKECEMRNVDVVLVKTQARFARDIELIDKYVHNLFKEWGVRFVTYIERIDNTKFETKKTSQITAMKDEWLLEDTSINIRATFKAKRSEGQFTGSFAPYGYIKDPENKNHLIIDENVANIIVRIFEEYNKGFGLDKIANRLTKDNILCPLEYKSYNGCNLKIPIIKDYIDYPCINKSGSYIIRIDYQNNERQILKKLTSIDLLTDNVLFNNKLAISLYKVKNEKIKLYYTTKSFEELNINISNNKLEYENNFDFEDTSTWAPIVQNEKLPNNTTCIATNIEELDRTHNTFYEFEVSLKENRNHISYYYYSYPKSNNENININYKVQIRNKHQWNTSTIKKFLSDEVYIGNLVQFKTTTVSYKNHTILYNDNDIRIRVENTHEPIIDLDLWYSVQEKLSQTKRSCKDGKVHVLANKVYCKNCHKVFYKCGKKDENNKSYLCCKDKATKWSNCNNQKYIKEQELHDYLIDRINNLLKKFYNQENQNGLTNDLVDKVLYKDQIDFLNKEKNSISKELESKNSYFQSLYEDLKKGLLDESQYISLRNKYKDDYTKLEQRLQTIEKKLLTIQAKKNEAKDKKALLSKYKQINDLNVEIVNDLIDKVVIGKYDYGTKHRHIHIVWNFTE